MIYFVFLSFLEFILFSFIFYYFYSSPLFFCTCKKLYISFPLAKTTGWLININLFFLLITQIKYIRKKIFLHTSFKYIHYSIVFYFYLWSIIHTVSHYINFFKLISYSSLFSWGVGFTGHILLFCLFLFFIFSLPYFRKNKFHVFISMHYTLTFILLIFSSFHGAFCFFKPDKKSGVKCFPTTWIWILLPTLFIFLEIIIKYSSKKYKIYNVISYPADIYEIRLKLPENYCGKTINICCPNISLIEWHPFSVSHINDNGLSSVFIKIRGNWTKKLSLLLGISNYNTVSPVLYPEIYIDGPFYSCPKNINDIIQNKSTVFISSGIGLTTFYNLLNSILLENKIIKNIQFIIVCKSIDELGWCMPTLIRINNFPNIKLNVFFTSDSSTNISFSHSFGRPNIESVFNYLNITHSTIDPPFIYFSGCDSLFKQISIYKNKYISNSTLYKL